MIICETFNIREIIDFLILFLEMNILFFYINSKINIRYIITDIFYAMICLILCYVFNLSGIIYEIFSICFLISFCFAKDFNYKIKK